MPEPTNTQFINVALDVQSSTDLSALVRALEPKTHVLQADGGIARFELVTYRRLPLETVLKGLLSLVEALPPEARAAWERCETRDFNAGFQAPPAGFPGPMPWFEVSPQTLQRMAALSGRLIITLYPSEESAHRKPQLAE